MVVTTMPSIQSLVNKLSALYPNYQWQVADKFAWNPASKTISYISGGSHAQLLHELGHAELRHDTYARDIELLRLERAAWTKAETIATDLGLTISQDIVEDHLDSYRDWLHQRSTCPRCNATGIQIDDQHYSCLECDSVWKVNEARNCGLKRYAK